MISPGLLAELDQERASYDAALDGLIAEHRGAATGEGTLDCFLLIDALDGVPLWKLQGFLAVAVHRLSRGAR